MTDTEQAHKKCSCSRNRQCALHQQQMRALRRNAQETHDRERVQIGIEELRAKYAKPPRTEPPARRSNNGWRAGDR